MATPSKNLRAGKTPKQHTNGGDGKELKHPTKSGKTVDNDNAPESSVKRKIAPAVRAKDIALELVRSGKEVRVRERRARRLDYESVQRAAELAEELAKSSKLWLAFIELQVWESKGAKPKPANRTRALHYVLRLLRGSDKQASERRLAVEYLRAKGVPIRRLAKKLASNGGYRGIEKRRAAEKPSNRKLKLSLTGSKADQHAKPSPSPAKVALKAQPKVEGPILLTIVTQSIKDHRLLGLRVGDRKKIIIEVLKTGQQHVWRIEKVDPADPVK